MDEEIVLRLPQDINKLCRTCLTITENILSHNILLIENNKTTLAAEMLQTCDLANTFPEDDLPQSICEDCAQKLEIAYNFKLQCQQTEKSIREILNLTADSTKETKKSKVDTPELFKTEISSLNTNISEDIQISAKGVTLYENNSNTNFIDNSNELNEESVLKLEILLEDKAITSDNNITSFSALSSQSSESSSQNGVLSLVKKRKHVQNSSKNNLETDEINSLIQERKLYNNTVSFEASNEFIKKETCSEDETLGEHVCEYCYMSFTNYDLLINHLQICESTGNNRVLEKLFKLENESMDNVEFYEEDANENFPPYECKTCGIYFKSKYARNGHMSTHGTNHEFDTQGAELRCDLCNKVYTSEAKLATHFQRHAVGLKNETSESTKQDTDSEMDEQPPTDSEEHSNDRVKKRAKPGDVKCEICNSGFLDEINLVRHLKKHGMQISVCKICLRRFDNAMKLKEHMKSHWTNHEGKIYKCPICKEQFPSAITLRNHAIAHLDENYECKKCKRSFNNKFSYEKHMKQHSEPRFLCSLCGKQYFSSVTLACHIRSHNNEKPFVCTFCKKGFSSRATLSVHKRIHSAFKPYICNYCGYSCRQSGDLAMHIRTHTGVKPYKCSFPNCDRKFTTSSQRKEHYRRHTNERNHKCPVCQKAFLESKTLKVHMLTHTGEKPHTCDVCGKRFRRTHHLSNHMKGHKDNLKL